VLRGQALPLTLTLPYAGLAVVDVLADIANGHGTAIATVALAWVLAQPGIVAPIAGASRPDQLPTLIAAAAVELTDDGVAQLTKLSDAVDE
jgi:aryl-alcohol dehydrogenase (NADP+)